MASSLPTASTVLSSTMKSPPSESDGSTSEQGAETTTTQQQVVWYFAYGANMSSKVLIGRRKVKPMESYPCYVEGYDLVFNMKGLPYFEPAFASIEKRQGWRMHGVVHKITREQMDHIRRTEGGNGHDMDDFGYREITVQATIYQPWFTENDTNAATSYGTPNMYFQTVDAIALQGPPDINDANPSARYLNILRSGAKEYGIAKEWQDHLNNTLQEYKSAGAAKTFGKFSFVLIILPLFILPLIMIVLSHVVKVQTPYFVTRMFKHLGSLVWWVHDNIWSKLFGSGKNNRSK
ncbi:hypothetical protein FDP41_000602 [Naegleria fowleri]|uniref:gamma-glutamylcyclotransferase n=1 Tax=Naegleria fowleri TaxID=5763 RepID=A0A6A5C2Q4_NAEFO|nr:uncharacterized protein FDP41_000602 [Naegleria fowleri]KAF0984703.1 hypothetical protein FDP41_000602 [Naegleria fowleri]CAG4710489.1 unnamed protein product [Naegleria fowleri]